MGGKRAGAERQLQPYLRHEHTRWQFPIGYAYADLVLPKRNLVVQVTRGRDRDLHTDPWLRTHGFTVVRYESGTVREHSAEIAAELQAHPASAQAHRDFESALKSAKRESGYTYKPH